MASNSDIKQHISSAERAKWNKCILDLTSHIGSGGAENHRIGDGTVPGFSLNSYTNEEKTKLAGVEEGALNNPHPPTHEYTMITGLSNIAHTGSWNDILNIPQNILKVINGTADAATVSGGIRITIGGNPPLNPVNFKEIWANTNTRLFEVFYNNSWVPFGSVYL